VFSKLDIYVFIDIFITGQTLLCIIRQGVSVLALIWFIRYIHYWNWFTPDFVNYKKVHSTRSRKR